MGSRCVWRCFTCSRERVSRWKIVAVARRRATTHRMICHVPVVACAAGGAKRNEEAETSSVRLLIRNGYVIDPSQNENAGRNLLIEDGRIVGVASYSDPISDDIEIFDATG